MLYIVKDAVSLLPIIIPENPSEVEEYAAEELRLYILKATGAAPEIIEENGKKDGIYVGHTRFAEKNDIKGNNAENWIIKTVAGSLVITGGITNEDRGIPYSVYHFLEDIVGVRWWNHTEEFVPSLAALAVDILDLSGTPAFPYRKTVDSFGYTDFYYSARNRINAVGSGDNVIDGGFNSSVRKTGGALWAAPPSHVHTLSEYFPPDEYFKTNPEWWGWDETEKRRRSDRQYCLSSESFYEKMREKLFKNICSQYKKTEKCGVNKPHFFSVSLPDDRLHCQCPECVASVEKSGRSGHTLKFINRLAKEIRDVYPDAVIETLAYWDYIEAPKDDTVPESNIIIRFAHLLEDISHSNNHPHNIDKMRMLNEWSAICKKTGASLYVWEYNLYLFPHFPLPILYNIPENYRSYKELGLKGCFTENELDFIQDFWCLNQWLLTRYMENPYRDFDSVMEDFLTKYYGDAAPYIREYLDNANSLMQNSSMYIMLDQTCTNFNYITAEFVAEGTELFDKAFLAVKDDKVLSQRVREASLALYRSAAICHDDLIRDIELRNLDVVIPSVEMACDRVLGALSELKEKYAFYINRTSVHYDNGLLTRIGEQEDLFTRIKNDNYSDFTVPDIIKGTKKEDIYNIPAYKIVRFLKNQNKVITEPDEGADSPYVLRYKGWVLNLTDKLYDKKAWKLPVYLTQNNEIKDTVVINKSDLDGEEYKWFSFKKVNVVNGETDSCIYVMESNGLAIKLSPIQRVFPFEKCDIYVRIKGEGRSFGSDKEKEDTICIDRFMIVRK